MQCIYQIVSCHFFRTNLTSVRNFLWTIIIGLIPFFASGQSSGVNNNKIADTSFRRLLENLKRYENSYSLGDTLSSSSSDLWDSKSVIDTIYLTKFKLIDKSFNSQFKPNKLEGYHCRFIGQYKYKDFILILTYSIRTYAGDGNPLLILSLFTDKGDLVDQIKTDLYGIHDPEIRPESRFSISKEFIITENQIEREFKLDNNDYVLSKKKSKIVKYKIADSGHFIRV